MFVCVTYTPSADGHETNAYTIVSRVRLVLVDYPKGKSSSPMQSNVISLLSVDTVILFSYFPHPHRMSLMLYEYVGAEKHRALCRDIPPESKNECGDIDISQ